MGLLDSVTDAIGLTDYRGAREARDQANMALSSQLGTSKELLDWWKTNSAPYQLGLMEKGLSLYDDAALTDRERGQVYPCNMFLDWLSSHPWPDHYVLSSRARSTT